MSQQPPITPPPKLVDQWCDPRTTGSMHFDRYDLAARAAQWGADQELEACCELLDNLGGDGEMIRRYRRPKPPSLKEQALEAMREMQIEPCIINGVDTNAAVRAKYEIIRRALEQLDD